MKKTVVLFMIILMACMLTGCFEAHISQKVTQNGKIIETSEVYINRKEYIDYMNNLVNATDTPAFTEKYLDKSMEESGYEIKEIDGMEYYVDERDDKQTKVSIAKWYKTNRSDTVKGCHQIWEKGFIMSPERLGEEIAEEMQTEKYDKEEGVNSEAMLKSCYLVYSVEFDSDIVSADEKAVIDPENPKKAVWRIRFDKIDKDLKLYALCSSDIQISGVIQGNSYKKPVSLHYDGAVSAVYNGREIANDKTFAKHGQHTVLLKSAAGEQRTVTFFIDKKKPEVKGISNNKTYKKRVVFKVKDKDSGIAFTAIDGKKQDVNAKSYEINKKGRHHIKIKDNAGNVKKLTVTIF